MSRWVGRSPTVSKSRNAPLLKGDLIWVLQLALLTLSSSRSWIRLESGVTTANTGWVYKFSTTSVICCIHSRVHTQVYLLLQNWPWNRPTSGTHWKDHSYPPQSRLDWQGFTQRWCSFSVCPACSTQRSGDQKSDTVCFLWVHLLCENLGCPISGNCWPTTGVHLCRTSALQKTLSSSKDESTLVIWSQP